MSDEPAMMENTNWADFDGAPDSVTAPLEMGFNSKT
jgi:hypothetical protein